MSTRMYNIMYNTYIDYCEMLQFTYYSAVKSIYYFDKVFVYDLQQKILKTYKEELSGLYLTLIEYNHKTDSWYQYMLSPRGIDNRKGIHCMATWKAYVNKHILFLNSLKKYDPYIGFRIDKLPKCMCTDEEKSEMLRFTKNKRNFNYSLTVLYVKRITKIKDINYKILTYLFHKRNFKQVNRIVECTRKASIKQIEGFYQ